jgi:choline dehydrogenase-like flavoprotein
MPSNEPQYDALVIGAGCAGSAVVKKLTARGLSVICLEQGDWVAPERRPKSHLDWESRQLSDFNWSPNKRRWPSDYPVRSDGANPVDVFMYSAVGGSAIGYGGHFWRFAPSDFRTRTLDGFGMDWPINYEELAPYYMENEIEVGTAGAIGDPTGPPREGPPPTRPIPIGKLGRKWVTGFEQLGWYWWPQEQAIISEDYRGRQACTNRGFCTAGCPHSALAYAEEIYLRPALALGATLRTNSRVERITTGADGRASGAIYYDGDGATHEVTAKVVVLCGNGLGSPRLLLMSASEQFPDGLANSSGMVGKNFMTHVQTMVIGRFEDRIDAHQGAWGGAVASRQFYDGDPDGDFKRGFMMAAMRGYPPLVTALAVAPPGETHHQALEQHLNHEGVIWVCGDDEPETTNFVELDWAHTDGFGLPGVRTHYSLSENSQAMSVQMVRRATELCTAAGAVSVRNLGFDSLLGWHLLGTARMGADPANSVVNADNRAHDVPNLFVVDGSSFTTGAAVNPTNTVQALALRAADKIWDQRRSWN